jgi:hypothetical protein
MKSPLEAHSWAEINYYLLVSPCAACGKGPWLAEPAAADAPNSVAATATCKACGNIETFRFSMLASAGQVPGGESINPTDEPSRIIDVGQWLGLFHMLAEQAGKAAHKADTRRMGFQAAQCLAEALKFYTDDELPPPSAVYTEPTRAALHEYPARFARQRLRDLQAKLPALHMMSGRLAAEQETPLTPRRSWWKFWQRRP